MRLWRNYGYTVWDDQYAETLSLWKYDPALDEPKMSQAWKNYSGLYGAEEDHSARLEVRPQAEEEQDQAAQIWVSDVERYNLVALTMEELPFGPPDADEQSCETITVLSYLRGNADLAQHRPSSIRILSSIMRRHHQSLFDQASATASDREFWNTLFIGLDRSWNISEAGMLEQRFGWVLEYIQEGKLPLEAQIARDILREALNPTFLRVLYQVQDMIQSWKSNMGIDGFCNTYGLLIAQLWEEIVYSTTFLEPQDKPSQFMPISPKQMSPSLMVLGPEGTQASIATLDSESDPQASATPAELAALEEIEASEEPELYHSVPHTARKSNQVKWTEEQVTYLHTLMGLDITWPERVTRFNQKFEGSRTTGSLKKKVKAMVGDFPSYKQNRLKRWTQEEKEHLRQLIATEESWDGVIQRFKEKFETDRNQMSMSYIAKMYKWDTTRLNTGYPWTEEQDQFLATLRTDEAARNNWPTLFEKEFAVSRSLFALAARLRKLGLAQKVGDNHHYTRKEEEYMRNLINPGLETISTTEICHRFWEKFGQGHSQRSIQNKTRRLMNAQQREAPPRVNWPWSTAEDDFLRTLSGSMKEKTAAMNRKFDIQRTEMAVGERSRRLKRWQDKKRGGD
ncbi:unnamed protein product [Clonostachys solani]|uniref:Myb-like domain-containing protein n=1 Tax=Clonostachys solani TaxID=160281 RepID=A0A9N9Z2Y7_9HYPO|nr:unnamed protein product [Clonostachys solani]